MKSSARTRNRLRRGLPEDAPRAALVDKLPVGTTRVHRGYVLVRVDEHHRADRYSWVYQHILVAEKKYGIRITRDFTIHHKNGDRGDNRPANLELRFGNHGKGADVLPGLLRDPAMRALARAVLSQYDD